MRLRARFGGSYELEHGFGVAARLSTGSDDPTSSQTTFGNDFEKQPMRLDEAYARYRYQESIELSVGKAPFPFENRRLLWDRDVRGEGLCQRLVAPIASEAELMIAVGEYFLAENGDLDDAAYLVGAQGGLRIAHSALELEIYAGYFDFVGVNQIELSHARGTNSTTPAGLLRDDFDLFDTLFGIAWRGRALATRAHLEVAHNGAAEDEGTALTVGGQASVSDLGAVDDELSVGYDYRYVERNAILDALAESSWHRQRTGTLGHRLGISYGFEAWMVSGSFKWMNTIDGIADRQREWLVDLRWTL